MRLQQDLARPVLQHRSPHPRPAAPRSCGHLCPNTPEWDSPGAPDDPGRAGKVVRGQLPPPPLQNKQKTHREGCRRLASLVAATHFGERTGATSLPRQTVFRPLEIRISEDPYPTSSRCATSTGRVGPHTRRSLCRVRVRQSRFHDVTAWLNKIASGARSHPRAGPPRRSRRSPRTQRSTRCERLAAFQDPPRTRAFAAIAATPVFSCAPSW